MPTAARHPPASIHDELHLRPAIPADLPAILSLWRAAALANPDDAGWLRAQPDVIALTRSQIATETFLLAERGTEILGFARLSPPDDGTVELLGLFVDPRHWRRGIARALLDTAMADAARTGATRIETTANTAALPFHAACGFARIGTTPTARGPAPRMRRALTGHPRT